jgi:hypothetical protein
MFWLMFRDVASDGFVFEDPVNTCERGSALPAASSLGPNRWARAAASAELRPRCPSTPSECRTWSALSVPRELAGRRRPSRSRYIGHSRSHVVPGACSAEWHGTSAEPGSVPGSAVSPGQWRDVALLAPVLAHGEGKQAHRPPGRRSDRDRHPDLEGQRPPLRPRQNHRDRRNNLAHHRFGIVQVDAAVEVVT